MNWWAGVRAYESKMLKIEITKTMTDEIIISLFGYIYMHTNKHIFIHTYIDTHIFHNGHLVRLGVYVTFVPAT